MALPEKLYALRKKSGLSQEQLAEALNVSRQAISKWEGGSAMPESDKLLALSNYFGVSLDYLLKDGAPNAAPAEAQEEHRTMQLLSLILCFGGAAALIVYGVLSILVPSVPAQISGSSMIRIDKLPLKGVDTADILLLLILFFLFEEKADDELLVALGLLLIL